VEVKKLELEECHYNINMSEVKVNKISPRSGTDVQLGDSGDTITIPAGATFDASSSTFTLPNGSVANVKLENSSVTINGATVALGGSTTIQASTAWQTSLKSSTFTAADTEGYFIDTSSNAVTMNLPAGNVGDYVEAVDATGTFVTNNFTISANGSEKIEGSTNNKILNGNNQGIRLVYSGAANGWVVPTSNIFLSNPTIDSISGNIVVGFASNLTLAGTSFLAANLTVNFQQTSDSIDVNVVVTPTSNTAATVAVPSSVYNNVTAGNNVTIKVTNSSALTSTGVDKAALAAPTGGSISNTGNFRVHTFTSSSNFVNQIPSLSCQYLIIAGGGGGGQHWAGGGGAGGYRCSVPGEVSGGGASAESPATVTAGTHAVVVGAGGTGGNSNAASEAARGNDGSTSSFFSLSSTGGGGGGADSADNVYGDGRDGGSGGGCGDDYPVDGGSGTSGQGYAGTSAASDYGGNNNGGGGGGASQIGQPKSGGNGATGGAGRASSINGSSTTRAGGGGGSCHSSSSAGPGGAGGGGAGGVYAAAGSNGSANTGGGGGGSPYSATGGTGGSGLVIIRYDTTGF